MTKLVSLVTASVSTPAAARPEPAGVVIGGWTKRRRAKTHPDIEKIALASLKRIVAIPSQIVGASRARGAQAAPAVGSPSWRLFAGNHAGRGARP